MTPPTILSTITSRDAAAAAKEEANAGADSLFPSSGGSVESIGDMMRSNLRPSGVLLVIDTDADGDQILVADDERNAIFRTQEQQHDVESAAPAASNSGSIGLPSSAQPGDSRHISSTSDEKYPKIPLNGSFDTADTEECSQASTDDGEVHLALGGRGDGFEDDEEQGQGTTASSSSQLGAKDLILQRLQMARDKLNDMLNWCEFHEMCFVWIDKLIYLRPAS